MRINELIKVVTKDYMPIKKKMMEAQREGFELSVTDEQTYFELNTTLELYKILKGAFMEEITKNKEVFPVMLANKLITTHQEYAEKNGETIKVTVVNESMDHQIDNLPEQFQRTVLERMVKAHKENVEKNYKNNPELLRKESFELCILEKFLPKEATKEDIEKWLNDNYPDGLDMKQRGPIIGKIKKAFDRADGKMISEVVKAHIA